MSNKAENLNSIFGANSLALYWSSQIWLMPSQTGCDMASPSKIMNRIMPRGGKGQTTLNKGSWANVFTFTKFSFPSQ